MNRRIIYGIIFIVAASFLMATNASAHVLVVDASGKVGSVLHVMPDDDPVAGAETELFFDVQKKDLRDDSVKIFVTDTQTGEESEAAVEMSDGLVTGTYTFATQGTYDLKIVVSGDTTYTFNYSQRVSRGATGSALDAPSYPIANLVLIFAATAFLMLLIIAFNNRTDIRTHSKL